jgi:hypothetical protein
MLVHLITMHEGFPLADAHGRQPRTFRVFVCFLFVFFLRTQLCGFLQPLHIIAANVRLLFPCESLNSLKAPRPGMSRPAISCSQPLALIGLKCILCCLKFFTCKNSSARRLNSKHERKVLSPDRRLCVCGDFGESRCFRLGKS